jgi:hypothetical protein
LYSTLCSLFMFSVLATSQTHPILYFITLTPPGDFYQSQSF